jgi:hypothetical protein
MAALALLEDLAQGMRRKRFFEATMISWPMMING